MSFSLRSRDLHIQFWWEIFLGYRNMADLTVQAKSSSEGQELRKRWLKVCHNDAKFEMTKKCDYMAYTAFKMIIFYQFRHALTRHDPKTYSIWCEALSVTLGFDVPPLSSADNSTPHFDWHFGIPVRVLAPWFVLLYRTHFSIAIVIAFFPLFILI